MPPRKRKAEQTEEAAAVPARVTRSSARVTRSSAKRAGTSTVAQPVAKLPVKKKGKGKPKKEREAESEKAEGDTSGNLPEDPNKTVVVIEHCKQCSSFKTRANLVKEGLEKSACEVTVIVNPEKPRRGCFEIRQQGGKTFISLLDMKRPFKPMKDLDMDKVISDIIGEISNSS